MSDSRNFSFKMVGKTLEMILYGDIGDEFDGLTAKAFVDHLAKHRDASEIVAYVNSIGGDAYEGASMYNALKRHKARKVMNVDGAAFSAMSLVVMAGDEIVMAENAMMMIHEPWNLYGFVMGTSDELEQEAQKIISRAATLRKLTGVYADTYAARSSQNRDDVLAMMYEETWFTATEAVEWGFADSVVGSKRVAARAVPEGRFKRTPPKLLVRKDADVSKYRNLLKERMTRKEA